MHDCLRDKRLPFVPRSGQGTPLRHYTRDLPGLRTTNSVREWAIKSDLEPEAPLPDLHRHLWSFRLFHSRLLTLRCLLRGLFFRVLFGHMPAHQATANRTHYRVMPGVVRSDPSDNRTLHAAGRVRRADRSRSENHCREGRFNVSSFHLNVLFY